MGGVWQTSVLRSINCKISLSGHFNSMKLTNAPGYPVIHTRNQSVTTKIDVHQASACIRLIACTKFSAKLVVMTKTLWLTPYLIIPAPSFLQLLQGSWGLLVHLFIQFTKRTRYTLIWTIQACRNKAWDSMLCRLSLAETQRRRDFYWSVRSRSFEFFVLF